MASDINECALEIDQCENNSTCINTYSSYHCSCLLGFAGVYCTEGKKHTCTYMSMHMYSCLLFVLIFPVKMLIHVTKTMEDVKMMLLASSKMGGYYVSHAVNQGDLYTLLD